MTPSNLLPFRSEKGNYEKVPLEDLEAYPRRSSSEETESVTDTRVEKSSQSTEIRLLPESNPSQSSSQLTPETFEWKNYVPYQLKLDEPALFPEFYYHFKNRFSSQSTKNRAYCQMDPAEFKATYVGTEQDIVASVIKVENDFESKFRECLDRSLLQEYKSWHFMRNTVETTFRSALAGTVDHVSYWSRMNTLLAEASADIDPLFDFLVAFQHSDESIWNHVILGFSRSFSSGQELQLMNRTAEIWKHEDMSIRRQIEGFAKELKGKGSWKGDPLEMVFAIPTLVFSFITFLVT